MGHDRLVGGARMHAYMNALMPVAPELSVWKMIESGLSQWQKHCRASTSQLQRMRACPLLWPEAHLIVRASAARATSRVYLSWRQPGKSWEGARLKPVVNQWFAEGRWTVSWSRMAFWDGKNRRRSTWKLHGFENEERLADARISAHAGPRFRT